MPLFSLLMLCLPLSLFAANCRKYDKARIGFKVQSGDFQEISGVISSTLNEGIYWVHNDSGGKSEIYAIDDSGDYIAKINFLGVNFKDAEDITITKCEDDRNCSNRRYW